MLTKIKNLHFGIRNVSQDVASVLNNLTGTRDFDGCESIEQITEAIFPGYIDTFNVYLLEKIAEYLESDDN